MLSPNKTQQNDPCLSESIQWVPLCKQTDLSNTSEGSQPSYYSKFTRISNKDKSSTFIAWLTRWRVVMTALFCAHLGISWETKLECLDACKYLSTSKLKSLDVKNLNSPFSKIINTFLIDPCKVVWKGKGERYYFCYWEMVGQKNSKMLSNRKALKWWALMCNWNCWI